MNMKHYHDCANATEFLDSLWTFIHQTNIEANELRPHFLIFHPEGIGMVVNPVNMPDQIMHIVLKQYAKELDAEAILSLGEGFSYTAKAGEEPDLSGGVEAIPGARECVMFALVTRDGTKVLDIAPLTRTPDGKRSVGAVERTMDVQELGVLDGLFGRTVH